MFGLKERINNAVAYTVENFPVAAKTLRNAVVAFPVTFSGVAPTVSVLSAGTTTVVAAAVAANIMTPAPAAAQGTPLPGGGVGTPTGGTGTPNVPGAVGMCNGGPCRDTPIIPPRRPSDGGTFNQTFNPTNNPTFNNNPSSAASIGDIRTGDISNVNRFYGAQLAPGTYSYLSNTDCGKSETRSASLGVFIYASGGYSQGDATQLHWCHGARANLALALSNDPRIAAVGLGGLAREFTETTGAALDGVRASRRAGCTDLLDWAAGETDASMCYRAPVTAAPAPIARVRHIRPNVVRQTAQVLSQGCGPNAAPVIVTINVNTTARSCVSGQSLGTLRLDPVPAPSR